MIKDNSVHDYVLEECEKINKKDYKIDLIEFCNNILSYETKEKEAFINSLYKCPLDLNEPTENELKAFSMIRTNKTKEFIELLRNEPSIRIEASKDGCSMLVSAVKEENLELIKFLVENKANINALDSVERDIIQIATLNCEDKTLNYLIENRFLEINKNKNLEIILNNGDVDLIDLESIDNFSATPLHYLAARGRIDLLKKLDVKLSKMK